MSTVTAERPQHLVVLDTANEIRFARAELKRQVRDGEVTVRDVVLAPPWCAGTMTLGELLSAQRAWGKARAGEAAARAGVATWKTLGSMTERQRMVLAGELAGARSHQSQRFTAPPSQPPEQRLAALAAANEIRTLRAQLKRDLKAGRCGISPLLLDPPDYLRTAKVFDMLLAAPKYGRVKANRALKGCRVSPGATFGGLSDRGRRELAEWMRQSSAVGVDFAPEHKSARRCANTPGHGNEGVSFDAAAA